MSRTCLSVCCSIAGLLAAMIASVLFYPVALFLSTALWSAQLCACAAAILAYKVVTDLLKIKFVQPESLAAPMKLQSFESYLQHTAGDEYLSRIMVKCNSIDEQKRISVNDVDEMTDVSIGQKRLMKMLITVDLEVSQCFDDILVEALDARDLGHHVEAESLFREAIRFAEANFGDEGYLLMPVLLHFCCFLESRGRKLEAVVVMERFKRIGLLYE